MERRELPRMAIKDATVRFKRLGRSMFWVKLSPHCKLRNLSKSGLAFSTNFPIKLGEKLFLKVFVPEGDCIPLKGVVRWKRKNSNANDIDVGIHFLPFGTHKEYNELESLEYLRKLLPNNNRFSSKNSEIDADLN